MLSALWISALYGVCPLECLPFFAVGPSKYQPFLVSTLFLSRPLKLSALWIFLPFLSVGPSKCRPIWVSAFWKIWPFKFSPMVCRPISSRHLRPLPSNSCPKTVKAKETSVLCVFLGYKGVKLLFLIDFWVKVKSYRFNLINFS